MTQLLNITTISLFMLLIILLLTLNIKKESFVDWNYMKRGDLLSDEYRILQYYRIRNINLNPNYLMTTLPYAQQSILVGYIRKHGDGICYNVIYDGFRDKFFAQSSNIPIVEIKSPDLKRNLDLSRKNKIMITNGIMKGIYLFQEQN